MSQSLLQMNTIFISIVIEALPFIVIGVFISAFIQMFITDEMIAKVMPKNRFLSIAVGTGMGALFPACECGIVPITERLVKKRVPLYAAIAFMLTGPIINPIVIFSTFVAFGDSWKMALLRCGLAIFVGVFVAIVISYVFDEGQLKNYIEKKLKHHHDHEGHHHHGHDHHHHDHDHDHDHGSHVKITFAMKMKDMVDHALDEFFSVGKFLVFGGLLSAAMQTYFKTSNLLQLGHNHITAILIMMLLAFILSICSEADAFIASSFSSMFGTGPILAFLVFGAMVDIKNLLMMLNAFKKKFVFSLIGLIAVFVFVGALLI
ncbi:permease [Bacillus ginsengihumi]|nr:permease [Heyndrickxia ginsengihumi]MCM3023636.1 permease [Heyndrickxia ginsengihumi]NEY18901.1 permease [Heyndrickxia ginsengihumi]